MFRGHYRKVRLLFGLADLPLVAAAFWLAYWTREHLHLERHFELAPSVIVELLGGSLVVWVVMGFWWQIYDRITAGSIPVILRDAFRQCLMGAAAVILLEYLSRLDLSRSFVGLFALFAWIALCLFRLNGGRMVRAMARDHFVMVVGTGDAARKLGRQVEEAHEYGVKLSGFLADDNSTGELELGRMYEVRALSALPDLLREHVIDELIFAVDSRRLGELEEIFLLCDEEGVRTRVAVDFFPHVNSQVYLERLGASPLLTFSATPHDEVRLLVKRIIDVILAGAMTVLLAPLMAIVAVLIRATSPGPAIFRQIRCGLNGRRFVFYKFRSMCENAEAMRADVEHLSERKLAMKIPNDPRLTGVGRWLRKFSLDELPQLWNVLKGDMSLVGPRPALPDEVEQYQRWQRRRLRMRPGLTCLWAVSGRDSVDFETWMKLDMQYIDRWSLALDWKILLRTIPQVLSGRGAH